MPPRGGAFEALARDLAAGEITRRRALYRLGVAGAAAVVPGFLLTDTAFAKCPKSRRCGSKCCPKGAKCKHGKCKCQGGRKKCGKRCVDVRTDPKNCGSCGRACPSGETCANGECSGGQPSQTCGNNVAEGGEACDGPDLRGKTCQSMGFTAGTLACQPDCLGFDTTRCDNCGANAGCGSGFQCDGVCVRSCMTFASCIEGETVCAQKSVGGVCENLCPCNSGFTCVNGRCAKTCSTDADCVANGRGGSCQTVGAGHACLAP
jgi:hypothetical protein